MIINFLRKIFPLKILILFYNFYLKIFWNFKGIKIIFSYKLIRLIKGKKELRMSSFHSIYLKYILENFDFYFEGVVPLTINDVQISDYSKPSWHNVKNFDLMPVFFNFTSEPLITSQQYLEFAELSIDSVAIDLGAYSGLTSILMDQSIVDKKNGTLNNGGLEIKKANQGGRGVSGFVIAIEADSSNFLSCKMNFSLYKKITNRNIHLINAAVWNNSNGILFSSEGSMGSSSIDFVGLGRGKSIFVKTITLDDIANQFKLKKVDFVKIDIEGSEVQALDCPLFFKTFKPKVIIEGHFVKGKNTIDLCKKIMDSYGYNTEIKKQDRYNLPLLYCYK
jgi:FkbM family methyltransferase